jgi:hypothetical protein
VVVPPGAVDRDHDARNAPGLADLLEQLRHALVAGDEAIDRDAGDLSAAPGERGPSGRSDAHRHHGGNRAQDAEHAPEGQLAAQPTAVGKHLRIGRHGGSWPWARAGAARGTLAPAGSRPASATLCSGRRNEKNPREVFARVRCSP